MNKKNFLKRLLDDERGQSTTEYILILSVMVMIAMKFKKTFGDQLDKIVSKLSADIGTAAESGQ